MNFLRETCLSKINSLFDIHAPLKKTSKYKLKFKTKPWITPGLQKSVAFKNKLLKNSFASKNPIRNYVVIMTTKITGIRYLLF